jgi:hypothetical protein
MNSAIGTASTGESVFCGSIDDPFFVDLGGVFDLEMPLVKTATTPFVTVWPSTIATPSP